MMIRIVLIIMLNFGFLFPKFVDFHIKNIKNTNYLVSYYFWEVSGTYFLMYHKKGSQASVWHYTNEKKWQALHNAPTWDGFKAKGLFFDKVEYNNGKVTIGGIIDSPENVLEMNTFHQIIASKTYDVDYYFWNKGYDYYLFSKKSHDYSIWYFTRYKKWMAIHNTKVPTSYPIARRNLSGITFDKNSSILTIGDSLLKNDNYLKLSFTDINVSKNNTLDIKYFTKHPEMTWLIEANNDFSKYAGIEAWILIAKNEKGEQVSGRTYSGNIFSTKKYNSIIPYSYSKCDKEYEIPPSKEKPVITFAIYGLKYANRGLLTDLNCFRSLNDELVSSVITVKIDKPSFSYTSNVFQEDFENNGSIQNSMVISSSFNVKKPILQSSISISNLPEGLTPVLSGAFNTISISLKGRAIKHDSSVEIVITLKPDIWEEKVKEHNISAIIRFLAPKSELTKPEPEKPKPPQSEIAKPEIAKPDFNLDEVKKEPWYKYQWSHHYTPALSRYVSRGSSISLEGAWKHTLGKGVVIGVIDSDFEVNHPEFVGKVIATRSYLGGTDVEPSGYKVSHGTAVAGIIVAPINGKGIVGVAPSAKLVLATMGLQMRISELIMIFEFMKQQKVQVVNNSWGSEDSSISEALESKIQDLYDSGITIVFASGNRGLNLDHGFKEEFSLSSVIGVGASNEQGSRSAYSNYGSALDVTAPGGYKVGVLTTDRVGHYGSTLTHNLVDSNYAFYNGTSFAAPITTGVIALMIAVNPNLKPNDIRTILIETADEASSFNIYTGYGKINATKAVERAMSFSKK